MRRLLAPALALGVLLAPSAHAAPKPQLSDARGDGQSAAQDVLWARLSSVRGDRGPEVRGELGLAAAPTVPGTIYRFAFHMGCHEYSFAYQVPSAGDSRPALNPTQPAMNHFDNCQGLPGSDADYPVSATVKGSVVEWRAPYVGHIARGAIVRRFEALSCVTATCGLGLLPAGDLADATGHYVMGSDLPRR